MEEEKWITEAKENIDSEVDMAIWNLEQLADKECVDIAWVLETFSNKFAYKVKELNKRSLN